jgi:polyhydroxyalkanoate synthesis repressor PhaR
LRGGEPIHVPTRLSEDEDRRSERAASSGPNDDAARRLVKRYANRKLYDTRESRYVTLPQIAAFVRDGQDVRIIDNTTKEDLTDVTLAQILVEEQRKGGRASAGSLRTLVQRGGERLITTLRDGAVSRLVRPEGADEPLAGAMRPDSEPDGDSVPASSRWSAAMRSFEELQRQADDRIRTLVANAMGHVRDLQSEIRHLQARIEELEERLKKATRRGRSEDPADDSVRPREPTRPSKPPR